jgi:methylmalonyl-CoA mutase
LKPQFIFEQLVFCLGISSSYFVEISKFRAFNSLLSEIAKKYHVTLRPADLIGKTSLWSKSVTDANTNMLRATTEAMSALLGNATGVEIDPYDHQFNKPNDFSSRISGNIATILREEAYFGKVSNPVKGSFYIEELSLKLAGEALELFKDTEAKGGFFKQIENENIQSGIAEIRIEKIRLLTQRKQAMVGVNKYPNLVETISSDALGPMVGAQNSKRLLPRRAGLELEQIRFNTERFVNTKGYRPTVEIASFGNPAAARARAAFSFDFMGVTAYNIKDEKSYESAQSAATATAASKSDIVVICSSDDDYREHALEFVHTFRSLDTDKILLLAGYPESMAQELKDAGLDGFIHMRSDILATLLEIQSKITKSSKPLEI